MLFSKNLQNHGIDGSSSLLITFLLIPTGPGSPLGRGYGLTVFTEKTAPWAGGQPKTTTKHCRDESSYKHLRAYVNIDSKNMHPRDSTRDKDIGKVNDLRFTPYTSLSASLGVTVLCLPKHGLCKCTSCLFHNAPLQALTVKYSQCQNRGRRLVPTLPTTAIHDITP